jgi:hypothetical protein
VSNPVPDGWLVPGSPQLLEAHDQFVSNAEDEPRPIATVADFWTWTFSDSRDNALCGVLAELIVGSALGATATRRKGWDNYDLLSPEGVRLEAKASGKSASVAAGRAFPADDRPRRSAFVGRQHEHIRGGCGGSG